VIIVGRGKVGSAVARVLGSQRENVRGEWSVMLRDSEYADGGIT